MYLWLGGSVNRFGELRKSLARISQPFLTQNCVIVFTGGKTGFQLQTPLPGTWFEESEFGVKDMLNVVKAAAAVLSATVGHFANNAGNEYNREIKNAFR